MAEDRTGARDKPRQLRGQKAPSSSQALAVATLFPIGGILLALSGLTLTGTLIGLAVAFPLFLLFSPILVPAAGFIGLALAGLFTSGAMGVTAVAALSCGARLVARVFSRESMERMKRQMADAAGQVRQKTKDVGQGIQSHTHDVEFDL